MVKKNNTVIDITAIILTYNEEKHIERCLNSIKEFAKKIIVIDSFSKDNTLDIAKKYNVNILQNYFINQSKQINWAINNIKFETQWILRIDADEYLTDKLKKEVTKKIEFDSQKISGITVNRKVRFFNKDINYGGVSPHKTLRIWKTGKGYCEEAWMDEQIVVDGNVYYINENLIDENLNNLSWWIKKHKSYALREAINYLSLKENISDKYFHNDPSKVNKRYKIKFYYKFPKYLRPLLLFLFNYIIRFGFLCGWQGLKFYFLQSLWFRFFVDLNISKIRKLMKTRNITLTQVIKEKYGYEKI